VVQLPWDQMLGPELSHPRMKVIAVLPWRRDRKQLQSALETSHPHRETDTGETRVQMAAWADSLLWQVLRSEQVIVIQPGADRVLAVRQGDPIDTA
jgi:hypothetical protein